MGRRREGRQEGGIVEHLVMVHESDGGRKGEREERREGERGKQEERKGGKDRQREGLGGGREGRREVASKRWKRQYLIHQFVEGVQ